MNHVEREIPARRTDVPALGIALIGIGLVLALSVLVGFVGSPETRFHWELASIFGTALGTTLLALATGWLAYSTRSEVRATQDLAELTREEQVARDRPVVLAERWEHDLGPGAGRLKVQLINVGVGPALRVRLTADYVGEDDWQPKIQEVIVTAIPPNERAEAQLSMTYAPGSGDLIVRQFRVTGAYEDRAGRGTYAIEQPIESMQRTEWRQ